ncbi:MAG: pilus assembly PilX N-terminal domain-containing protein [Sedimentisphaerales bacterium]
MITKNKPKETRYCGAVLIMVMILLAVCSTFAVSMAAMSRSNITIASNQNKIDSALSAAQSGLECCRFVLSTLNLPATNKNYISRNEADQVWKTLCRKLQNTALDGKFVPSAARFSDAAGSGDQISTRPLNYADDNTSFSIRFYRYDNDPNIIKFESRGTCQETIRNVNMDLQIAKSHKVLNYAVASRGRVWLTGDARINGDVFSAWTRAEVSPYFMTSDSAVFGTVNTVLTLDQVEHQSYRLETLNSGAVPVDKELQPLGFNYGDRFYGPGDKVRAYHEGINYARNISEIPGLSIADYDTDMYNSGLRNIEECPSPRREIEYFPHAPGNYNSPRDGTCANTWNRKLYRHVYENRIFKNVRLPGNRNALFRNCTFKGILYIDCNKNAIDYYNNVRFENCTFNGIVVTDVPQKLKWQCNCLYFTGQAKFQNTSGLRAAAILAPNFNINFGNTNPDTGEYNIMTGVIIGGVVDIRGSAEIHGSIISMCDTSQWPSGYVTNIGATLEDGGSETAELGRFGVINITPDRNQSLPGGIRTPIIVTNLQETYSEG